MWCATLICSHVNGIKMITLLFPVFWGEPNPSVYFIKDCQSHKKTSQCKLCKSEKTFSGPIPWSYQQRLARSNDIKHRKRPADFTKLLQIVKTLVWLWLNTFADFGMYYRHQNWITPCCLSWNQNWIVVLHQQIKLQLLFLTYAWGSVGVLCAKH